jgi:hypothetical protein
MKHAVEMGSGAKIDEPKLIKISSGIQKLIGREVQRHINTEIACRSHKW